MMSTPVIDRIAPTQRPAGKVVMRPVWSHLLFLHWRVDARQLQDKLPPGLELDLYDGHAYIGLIPFTMTGVRPRWIPPLRALTDFHEINVRTYVHHAGGNPGVWFFSLDAASAPAVCAARLWYKLPYFYARMKLKVSAERIEYATHRRWPRPLPAHCHAAYTPTGAPYKAELGTLEHFLVERYILYSYARGKLYSGRVHHAPYPLQSATIHSLDENLIAAAGVLRSDEAPIAHYAQSVHTEIFDLETVR